MAYLLCLQYPNVEILAVTTVCGNNQVDQVLRNVATVNQNMEVGTKVPFYPGST